MSITEAERKIENEYHVSWYIIAYKLLFGLVEFLFGITIILFGQQGLALYQVYVAQELSEDPHDLIIHLLGNAVPNLLTHSTFLAAYLMILGGAKIAGAVGLIHKQNWGVDLLVGLTLLMLPFQLIQLILHPSAPDFIYIFVGVFVALYLINFRPHKWAMRIKSGIQRKP